MMSLDDVIMSGDVMLQCFVPCCKIDKKKTDVLCVGTMKGHGRNKLLYHIKTKRKLSKRCVVIYTPKSGAQPKICHGVAVTGVWGLEAKSPATGATGV